MLLLVMWLFVETQRAVERERRARLDGRVTPTLRRERCTYAIVSFIFALSYIGRYYMNEYAYYGCGNAIGSIFANCMTEIVVFFFEGASMGVLMFFHFKNFR